MVFAVSLLAAFGVTWLRAHLPRRAFVPVAGALGTLLALEYATFPLTYGRVPALARPVDRAIAAAPADAVVLEWPAYVPMTDADAMFRSLGHGRRVVNGYSGFVPRLLANLSALMTQPGPPYPSPAAEAYLRRIYPLELLVVRLGRRWRSRGARRGGSSGKRRLPSSGSAATSATRTSGTSHPHPSGGRSPSAGSRSSSSGSIRSSERRSTRWSRIRASSSRRRCS